MLLEMQGCRKIALGTKWSPFYVGRLFLHQVLDVGTLNVGFSIFAETIFIVYSISIEGGVKTWIGSIG